MLQSRCLLCRKKIADCKGSHIVPNFLLQSAFTYDQKAKRNHEVSFFIDSNSFNTSLYIGREVNEEKIFEVKKNKMTDEEVIANTNHFIRNYLFCTNCEKRFAVVENEYASFINGIKQSVNPRLAYLLWLSVIWRMSVTHTCIQMPAALNKQIRIVLDSNLSLEKKETINSKHSLGSFAYLLMRFPSSENVKTGLLAERKVSNPYLVLIGTWALFFFPKRKKILLGKSEKNNFWGLDTFLDKKNLNTGSGIEICLNLTEENLQAALLGCVQSMHEEELLLVRKSLVTFFITAGITPSDEEYNDIIMRYITKEMEAGLAGWSNNQRKKFLIEAVAEVLDLK